MSFGFGISTGVALVTILRVIGRGTVTFGASSYFRVVGVDGRLEVTCLGAIGEEDRRVGGEGGCCVIGMKGRRVVGVEDRFRFWGVAGVVGCVGDILSRVSRIIIPLCNVFVSI